MRRTLAGFSLSEWGSEWQEGVLRTDPTVNSPKPTTYPSSLPHIRHALKDTNGRRVSECGMTSSIASDRVVR
jgi:hypothetical protein